MHKQYSGIKDIHLNVCILVFRVVNDGRYKSGATLSGSASGTSYKVQYYAKDTSGARKTCSFNVTVQGKITLTF